MEILASGGNAFDAAVAVSAALAVVEPKGSGLGGGGFYLLHRASDGKDVFLDAREVAPGAATPTMFLDDKGNARSRLARSAAPRPGSRASPRGLRISPSTTAGCRSPTASRQRSGSRAAASRSIPKMRSEIERACGRSASRLDERGVRRGSFSSTAEMPPVGHVVRQPELARIARGGRRGRAPRVSIAGRSRERLVRGVRAMGGIWTLAGSRRLPRRRARAARDRAIAACAS